MTFFHALTAGLPGEVLAPIRDAIDHKNNARLAEALARVALGETQHNLLQRLPDLIGGPEVLKEARRLSAGLARHSEAQAALDRLDEVYGLLHTYGVAGRIILDLSEVRGMDYYTGITFRGVAPGLGWPLVSGGRYDDLIAQFGRSMAAVGFGLGIERALLVQARQGAPAPSPEPDLLVECCNHSHCLALVQRLRLAGYRVETDVLRLDRQQLAVMAQRRGIRRLLYCTQDGWCLRDEAGERAVTEGLLLSELHRPDPERRQEGD
jgi:ATP phosphoribosyltransferase regulatory subunit